MLTFRAIFVGILLIILLTILSLYSMHILHGSLLACEFVPVGAVFFLFLLVIFNFFLKRIRRSFAFSSAELLVVMLMLWTASSIITMGFVANFVPIISGLSYYGTPDNGWQELILPHVPSWLIVKDESAIRHFYEGLPSGQAIPWKAWLIPLAAWVPFFLCVVWVMICIVAILHKQWSQNEKLLYPLAELPVAMVSQDNTEAIINSFFKNRVMWLGFATAFLWASWEGLTYYFHFLPPLPHRQSIPIFQRTTDLTINLRLPIVGFAYLMSLDISFSLWFFAILGTVQSGIQNVLGFSIGRTSIFSASSASVSYQGMGAMIALVALHLWLAKRYLKDYIKKVFSSQKGDQDNQLLSPRVSFWGMVAGFAFMAIWLTYAGLSFWLSLLFLLAAFIIFLALTRIVAQSGIPTARSPLIAQDFLITGVGSSAIGTGGLIALAYTFSWAADVRTFAMASVSNSLKMVDGKIKKMRSLLWPIGLAVIVSLTISIWMTMRLGYRYGGINLHTWFFIGCPKAPFEYIASVIEHPVSVGSLHYLFMGIGAVFMAFLVFMQHRFLWWPINPIGFPIANTYPVQWIWFSIFIGWLLKSLLLRYGGPRIYRKSKPFFLGLILGHFVCVASWVIIDYFTGTVGNTIPFFY